MIWLTLFNREGSAFRGGDRVAHRGRIVKALFAADMHENPVDPVAARTSEFIVSSQGGPELYNTEAS